MKPFSVAVLAAVAWLALGGSGLEAQEPQPGCPPPPCKVCVSEPKHNTKTVYGCKEEEYCLPRCGCCLSALFGHCGCDEGPCGDLRVRRRLVVKKVPGCDTTQCVPREVPVPGPARCAQAAPGAITPPPPGTRPPDAPAGGLLPDFKLPDRPAGK
jgi:hypothetical protein